MESWERDLLTSVAELKELEKADRPVPKNYEYKAKFRGIVTLANTAQAQELANLIQSFIGQSVEIFHNIQFDASAPQTLLRNLNRMVALLDTFPNMTMDSSDGQRILIVDEMDREGALKNLSVMKESQQKVNSILSGRVTSEQLKGDDGRVLATELKVILERLMNVARIMENFQRKLLTQACQKAAQITTIMRNASTTNKLADKISLFNKHIDNLINLTAQRMDMLDNIKEGNAWKNKLWVAIEEIKRERFPLEDHVNRACIRQDVTVVPLQIQGAETIVRCANEIADIAEQSAQKATGNFDHTITIQHQLDLLSSAVKKGSGPEAAQAARQIANEVDKLQKANPVKGVKSDDENDGRSARDLQDAYDRMNKMLRDLTAASAKAIKEPETLDSFDELVRSLKNETLQVENKNYDSVSTELASSGMIEAAAQAAQQLALLFQ